MPTDLDRTLAWLEGCFSVAGKELDALLAVARAAARFYSFSDPRKGAAKELGATLDALAALGPATPKETKQ